MRFGSQPDGEEGSILNSSNKNPRVILVQVDNTDEDPASRQKLLNGWDQKKIEDTKVLVAGAGAIGNELVKDLVLLGFGEIYIVDFDKVVASNLNRCTLLRSSDVKEGRFKAEAVASRAKELDPYGHIKIESIVDEISDFGLKYSDNVFRRVNIIFGTVDNLASRVYLTIASQYNQIPYIDGGMWGAMGNVFVMVPPNSSCYVCSISESSWMKMMQRLQCSMKGLVEGPIIPSLPTTASIVAAIQVQEALKIIHSSDSEGDPSGLGSPSAGKMISFNLVTNDWFTYIVPKRGDCPICSHSGGI